MTIRKNGLVIAARAIAGVYSPYSPPATAGRSKIVEVSVAGVSRPSSRRTSSPSTKTLRKLGTPSPSRTRGSRAGKRATSDWRASRTVAASTATVRSPPASGLSTGGMRIWAMQLQKIKHWTCFCHGHNYTFCSIDCYEGSPDARTRPEAELGRAAEARQEPARDPRRAARADRLRLRAGRRGGHRPAEVMGPLPRQAEDRDVHAAREDRRRRGHARAAPSDRRDLERARSRLGRAV